MSRLSNHSPPSIDKLEADTNDQFSQGPESNTSESTGIIQNVSVQPTEQAGRHVGASNEHPRYEVSKKKKSFLELPLPLNEELLLTCISKVQNENTGKTTTIYEDNILGPV